MKNSTLIIIAAFLLFSAAAGSARAEKNSYVFGFRLGSTGTNQDAQIMLVVDDIMKIVSQRSKQSVSGKILKSDEESLRAMEKHEADYIYLADPSQSYIAMKKYGYVPLVTFSLYGIKAGRTCFYVNKDSRITALKDAKGKRLSIMPDEYGYFIAYKLSGMRPEDFFGNITASPNLPSTAYALGLNAADIILIGETTVKHLQATNPGAVKNMRLLACGDPMPQLPAMRAKDAPENITNTIIDVFVNFRKVKELRKYWAIVDAAKGKFYPVTVKDYEPMNKFFDECIKKGWDKDYRHWMKSRK